MKEFLVCVNLRCGLIYLENIWGNYVKIYFLLVSFFFLYANKEKNLERITTKVILEFQSINIP